MTGALAALVLATALAACDDGNGDGDADEPDTSETTAGPSTTAPAGSAGGPGTATGATTTPTATVPAGPSGPGCAALPVDEAPGLTLAELIAATPELSQLDALVQQTGLAERLADPGPLTLIAPTDAAFAGLDASTRDTLTADQAAATRILELHLVLGDHALADLTTAGTVARPSGNLTATAVYNEVVVDTGGGPAAVTCRDVVTANGRLHLVDGVLLPPPADTEAIGGSRLYRVEPSTGAATPVGAFGEELGVLDVVALDDTTLLGLTDSAELITFSPDAPDAPTARVTITGVEGATLLDLDQTADGDLLAVSDLNRAYRLDPATGAATPMAVALDPGVDDLGVAVDTATDGTVRLLVATGTDLTIDPAADAVVATGPSPAFADGDPNAGTPARIVAAATVDGDLLVVDATTGVLARLLDDGTLATLGPLDVVLTDGAGLDATPAGALYLTVPG